MPTTHHSTHCPCQRHIFTPPHIFTPHTAGEHNTSHSITQAHDPAHLILPYIAHAYDTFSLHDSHSTFLPSSIAHESCHQSINCSPQVHRFPPPHISHNQSTRHLTTKCPRPRRTSHSTTHCP
ncbi:hypothetical protein AVEN_23087-1 [Araneus ventricosus]|uniref:Uncharacterized protein n=1 Tax=Araneus ventricosus TaxID=182803 RepID=A0A4Y2QVI1_ARAVE|nr:hypothetical protein AVEN_23087-1 [Araneus ventricosus]